MYSSISPTCRCKRSIRGPYDQDIARGIEAVLLKCLHSELSWLPRWLTRSVRRNASAVSEQHSSHSDLSFDDDVVMKQAQRLTRASMVEELRSHRVRRTVSAQPAVFQRILWPHVVADVLNAALVHPAWWSAVLAVTSEQHELEHACARRATAAVNREANTLES